MSASALSPALGTAPLYAVLQLGSLLAVAHLLGHEGTENVGWGGWVMGAAILWIVATVEWLGYGLHPRIAVWRRAERKRRHDDAEDEDLELWRAERFATIAFWLASLVLVAVALAALAVIRGKEAMTLVGSVAGLVPFVWFASLPAYRTRPPARWVRRHCQDSAK